MEKFTVPEMEIVEFESEDIITTSGGCDLVECTIEAPVCNNKIWDR